MGNRPTNNEKVCENQCPNCGATSDDIEWGHVEKDSPIYQSGTCKKCGCKFDEVHSYSVTMFNLGDVSRVPCTAPLNDFYNFMDQVPDGNISTSFDCAKCEEQRCDLKHCFIIDGVPHYPMG